jgi:Collagen triple helix repeat (20 copies)
MFSPLRNRFGIPGVISVIALVFAMLGGAYAANNSGSGDSKASASAVKKGPRGPRGPKGPAGPAGPAGVQGPAGPQGAKGDTGAAGANGKDGTNGTNGSNGTSATTASFAGVKAPCTEGGVEVKSANPTTLVCNGVKGADGEDGSPWTAGGVLPPNATQTGLWTLTKDSPVIIGGFYSEEISFPIPLKAALDEAHVRYVESEVPVPADCNNGTGAAPGPANPEADPGFLCVFVAGGSATSSETIFIADPSAESFGAGTIGARIVASAIEGPAPDAFGSYAVTGAP